MDHTAIQLVHKLISDYFAFVVVSARFFGAMAIFPVLSANYFSKMLKVLLAFSFAMVIFPSLDTSGVTNAATLVKFGYVAKEYFVGFILGFILATPIWVIQGAGSIIDNQRGEQMGAVISNLTQAPSSSLGALLLQSFVVYFLSMNGLVFFAGVIYKSFTVIPFNDFFPALNPHLVENYIDIFKSYITWTVLLSMPVVLIMFLIEIILGLLSTFLPQLNVTVLSLPIKSCVGILILIMYVNHFYQFTLLHFLDKIKGVYV